MITRAEFKKALQVIKEYRVQMEGDLETINKISKFKKSCGPDTTLEEAGISSILSKAIGYYFCEHHEKYNHENWISGWEKDASYKKIKVHELSIISTSELFKYRDIGKKTINELRELCYHAGVELQE